MTKTPSCPKTSHTPFCNFLRFSFPCSKTKAPPSFSSPVRICTRSAAAAAAMVKGEDAIRRKKNKANRKRLSRKETVSARVAAIIATKKRRKSGKRRVSEGMCFSLPTPEDPFKDRYRGKKDSEFHEDDILAIKAKRLVKKQLADDDKEKKNRSDDNSEGVLKKVLAANKVGRKIHSKVDEGKVKQVGNGDLVNVKEGKEKGSSIRPSKVLLLCLNTLQNALQLHSASDREADRPFFANKWGIEFLKNYTAGNDMLVVSESGPSMEQTAWMVSTAADSIQKMEMEGLSTPSPFLLYIVPTQARATEVRSVCKPLKGLGIHTVSVHSGVSIEHQIHGLKSCEPEFIVSTPERLLELILTEAINVSGVSLMVVDKLELEDKESHHEVIKSVRQYLSESAIIVVYGDGQSASSPDGKGLLRNSFSTLSPKNSDSGQKKHVNRINNKHIKIASKKKKFPQVKESCHCCH